MAGQPLGFQGSGSPVVESPVVESSVVVLVLVDSSAPVVSRGSVVRLPVVVVSSPVEEEDEEEASVVVVVPGSVVVLVVVVGSVVVVAPPVVGASLVLSRLLMPLSPPFVPLSVSWAVSGELQAVTATSASRDESCRMGFNLANAP
jgi:hypothetical protein